jgi:hypothetical protein
MPKYMFFAATPLLNFILPKNCEKAGNEFPDYTHKAENEWSDYYKSPLS